MADRDREMADFAAYVKAVIARGQPAEIATVLHPDAQVWENTDGRCFTMAQVGAFHHALAERLDRLEFEDTRITATSEGYIDRHVKRLVERDGREYRVPACLCVTVRDGKIVRAEEYLDASQLPAFVADVRAHIAGDAGR